LAFPVKTDKRLGEILVDQGTLSPVQIHRVLKKQAQMKQAKGYQIRLGELLLRERMVDETLLAKAVAEQWGIDFLDLADVDFDLEDFATIPWDIIKRVSFVPIRRGSVDWTVAVDEEPDEELYGSLNASRSGDIFFVISPREQVQAIAEHVRTLFQSGKNLRGATSLRAIKAGDAPVAGPTKQVERAVAAISDDEPLVGALQFRGQKKVSAVKLIKLDDGIEDITDLDQSLPKPAAPPIGDFGDELQFSSGDALDEILPRLRDEGRIPSAIDPKAQAPIAETDNDNLPDPMSLIPDEFGASDNISLHDDVQEAHKLQQEEANAPDSVEPAEQSAPDPVEAFDGLLDMHLGEAQPTVDMDPTPKAPSIDQAIAPSAPAPPEPPAPPAREEKEQVMAADQTPKKRSGKMNPLLKELLLQAVTQRSLGISFVQTSQDVAVYAKGVVASTELGRLPLVDFGDIVQYLGAILKADLTSLTAPLKRKIKLKVGAEAHLFQFLFIPTQPLSMNINILDESLVRLSLDTLGLESHVLDKIKESLVQDYGLTVFSSPNIADLYDVYLSALWFLAESKRKVISFEDEPRYEIPGISRYALGRQGADPRLILSSSCLRTVLDAGYDNLCSSYVPDNEALKALVNLSLSEVNTIVCVEAKDCLTSFMTVKKSGISTSSLLEAALFLINVRRVNKVCPFCKETFLITKDTLPPPLADSPLLLDVKAYRGKGCDLCKGTGVSGTTLIFETMEVDSERINIQELTRTKKPLKAHLLETGLLKPLAMRTRNALLSGRITLKEYLDIVTKL